MVSGRHMKIFTTSDMFYDKTRELAERLDAVAVRSLSDICEDELYLRYDEDGLSLVRGKLDMRGDFTQMKNRILQKNLEHEMIIRAVRLKDVQDRPLKVFDATAGMGEDSFILAAAGFEVTMYEYDKVIAMLLMDALVRAGNDSQLAATVGRMKAYNGDSIEALGSLSEHYDVVFLDPMFPKRTKSAMIGKKFQLLQQLEAPCGDEEALLNAAIEACPRKIVIKRPAKGAYLAGVRPDFSYEGKAVRYDCLINNEARKQGHA